MKITFDCVTCQENINQLQFAMKEKYRPWIETIMKKRSHKTNITLADRKAIFATKILFKRH